VERHDEWQDHGVPAVFTLYPVSLAICHLPFAICHLPFAIRHLPSAIRHLPSAIRHLPSAICHLPRCFPQAEWIAGLELTDKERESAAKEVLESLGSFQELRKINVGYDVPPALTFVPAPGLRPAQGAGRNQARPTESRTPALKRPDTDEALAFLSVADLSALIRSRKLSSTELTKLHLGRLKRFNPLLKCVVTLTEDLALAQAARADAEIAAGKYRGPLHGIPWGAKDLIAYPGIPRRGAPRSSRAGCSTTRPRPPPRDSSASRWGARRSAASSHPAGPAAARACGQPSAG